MAPAAMSGVQNMQEILFAQRLADNDKKIRDRSLKKLRKYFAVKSSNGPGFTEDDMIKIWKGLFYCMYMADKPLVQEDLSENISGLISEFGNNADRRCFFKAAMATFAREWQGLDVFRYDKFMMLVRKVLRYTFTFLLEQEWALKEVTAIAAILEDTVLCPDDNLNRQPMGLKLHVCDIFLEELAKIGGEALESDVIVALLQPFMKVLAISGLDTLTKKVSSDIIRYLMKQSDAGIEDEVGENMEMEEDEQDENEQDENEEDENEDAEAESQEDEGTLLDNGLTIASTGPLDPRAGGVDVCLPQLRPNWGTLADALQALGSIGGVKQKNRDNMYKLVGELRDLSAGVYPLEEPEDNEDSDIEVPQDEMEKALDRLQMREEKLEAKILKGKKWKKNQNKEDDDEEPKKPFVSESSKIERKRKKNKRKKKFKPDAHTGVKKQKPNTGEDAQLKEEVSARLTSMIPEVEMESTEFNEVANALIQKTKKKKNRKKKKNNGFEITNINIVDKQDSKDTESITENPIVAEETNTNMLLDVEIKIKKKKKKKNKNIDISDMTEFVENKSKKEKKKNISGDSFIESDMNEFVENKSKKGKKKKKNISGDSFNDEEKLSGDKEILPEVGSISITKEKKKKKKKEKELERPVEKTEIVNVSSTSESNVEKIKKKKKKRKLSETETTDMPTTNVKEVLNESSSKSLFEMIRKKKEEFKIDTDSNSGINNVVSDNKPKTELVLNFASSKKDSQVNPWDEPLRDGEIEVFIKSKKQIAKEKKKKKKVISSPLKKSPAGKRAIKINLKANQDHTFKEYERDVKKASTIALPAFPASPGILKPSPSPILVRKKSKLNLLNRVSSSASPQLKKSKKFRMQAADFFN